MASYSSIFSTRPSRADTQPTDVEVDLEQPYTNSHELQVENIVSFRAFLEYLTYLPTDNLKAFNTASETLRQLFSPTEASTQFVASGHSFTVHAKYRPQIPPAVAMQYSSLDLKPRQAYAVKSRHINQTIVGQRIELPPSNDIRVWTETAWECHILTHPPLAKSPNIVTILGIVWESVLADNLVPHHIPVLAMEYADQGSLEELLQPVEFCLHPKIKKQILLGVCLGLHAMHSAGIIHSDLKADNILLFDDGDNGLIAKISDFGFTLHGFGHESSRVQLRGYSPPWDAPEIRSGEVKSDNLARVDMYSYGLLYWRVLLDGLTPFDANTTCTSEVLPELRNIAQLEYRSTDWLHAIHALKSDVDDLLLHNILATLPTRHDNKDDTLHAHQVLSMCLRQEPVYRADAMSSIATVLNDIPQFPDTVQPGTKVTTANPVLRYAATKALTPDLENTLSFHGAKVSSGNFDKMRIVQQLPTAMRRYLALDYRYQALDESNTRSVRAWSAFNYALCIVIQYDTRSDEEAVQWMQRAAELGSLEAKSFVFRFSSAIGSNPADPALVVRHLAMAAVQGSMFALRDLELVDRETHRQVVIECSETVDKQPGVPLDGKYRTRAKTLAKYPLDDPAKLFSYIETLSKNPLRNKTLGKMLRRAAAFDFVSAIGILIASGADVDHRDQYGKTPLLWACQKGCESSIFKLIEHGADCGATDWLSGTPLHYTVYVPSAATSRVVQNLTSHGADVHAKAAGMVHKPTFSFEKQTPSGTPLHWAVRHGNMTMVRALLAAGASCLEPSGLQAVIDQETHSVVQHHRERTEAESPGISFDRSPLEYAIEDFQADMVELMLKDLGERHIEIDLANLFSEEATADRLQLIHLDNFQRTMELLLDGKTGAEIHPRFLHEAIKAESTMIVQYLLGQGSDPNARLNKWTPLGLALSRRNADIGLLLLRGGADPRAVSTTDEKLFPPGQLFYFLDGVQLRPVVEEILARGADCHTFESQYLILLGRAILENWQDVVRILLEKCPNLRDDQTELLEILLNQNSKTATTALRDFLHYANIDGRLPVAVINDEINLTVFHVLMAVGEDIRDDELNRKSLGVLLQYYSSRELVNECISYTGTLVDGFHETNGRGWYPGSSALSIAVQTGNAQGARALLEAGADPYGGTVPPLFVAVHRLLDEKQPSWIMAKLGGRQKRVRRYRSNSINTVLAFLHHELSEFSSSPAYRGYQAIERCLPTWKTSVYREALKHSIQSWCDKGDSVSQPTPSPLSAANEPVARGQEDAYMQVEKCEEIDTATKLRSSGTFDGWAQIKADWKEAMMTPNIT